MSVLGNNDRVALLDAHHDMTDAYTDYLLAVNARRCIIQRLHRKGASFREIAHILGIGHAAVKNICNGRVRRKTDAVSAYPSKLIKNSQYGKEARNEDGNPT